MAATDASAPDWGSYGWKGEGASSDPRSRRDGSGRADAAPAPAPAPATFAPAPATFSPSFALRRARLTAANDAPSGGEDAPTGGEDARTIGTAHADPQAPHGPWGPWLAWFEEHVHTIVPALTVVFLLSIALLRGLVLLDMREQALEDAHRELYLAALVAERDVGTSLSDAIAEMKGASTDIARFMAQYHAERDLHLAASHMGGRATLVLANEAGTVVADNGAGLAGRELSEIVHGRTLLGAGAAAGVRDVRVGGSAMEKGEPVMAVVRPVQSGRLVMWRTHADALARWRERLSANAAQFALTFAMLMTLLAIYLSQAARARDRDERYQDALRRMESALGRGRCGLWQWDVTRGSVRWSRSMYDILGLPVPGSNGGVLSLGMMRQHVHPADDMMVGVALDVLEGSIDQMDAEFRMRHANGEWVWIRARCELEMTPEGPFLSGIAMDVTDQRAVEQARRAAEERLDDAVRNVNEAFVLWDADDRLVMCNDKFREWHELPASRVAPGTPRSHVLSPSQRAARTRALAELVRCEDGGGESAEGQPYEVRLAGGRWLQVSERRMSDGSLAVIGTDVTLLRCRTDEARRSEARLRASVKSLNASEARRRQRERDLEAATRELKAQKEAAEKASTAKSDFMANMSHELRTPLNAIIGFSEMMGSGLFGPLGADEESAARYREYAGDIHSSASHLLDVIGDILDMSRIEAGRFDLEMERLDICPVVEESVRTIALKAAEKGITVDTSITRRLSLDADQRAIKQVLLNVLSNAVKFTPEGGRITVSARRVKGHMRLAIQDTGIGIPKEALKRVLCPFEQVQNRYTREHEGSGLGLAISRSLIEMHGGRMRITSEINTGTTVSVLLPLAATGEDEDHADARAGERTDAPPAGDPTKGRPLHGEGNAPADGDADGHGDADMDGDEDGDEDGEDGLPVPTLDPAIMADLVPEAAGLRERRRAA